MEIGIRIDKRDGSEKMLPFTSESAVQALQALLEDSAQGIGFFPTDKGEGPLLTIGRDLETDRFTLYVLGQVSRWQEIITFESPPPPKEDRLERGVRILVEDNPSASLVSFWEGLCDLCERIDCVAEVRRYLGTMGEERIHLYPDGAVVIYSHVRGCRREIKHLSSSEVQGLLESKPDEKPESVVYEMLSDLLRLLRGEEIEDERCTPDLTTAKA